MRTPSYVGANPDPSPSQANAPGAKPSQELSPDERPTKPELRPVRWFQRNSFAPRWLPEPLRHPLLGYLAAMLIQLAAAAVILLLLTLFPAFAFRGVLINVGIILIALGWGAGPGLFATLVGTFLIYYIVLFPHFSWSLTDPPDAIGVALYLVVGVGISLLASQIGQARRLLEKKNQLLAEAEVRSRLDAQRLRTVLDVLPSAVLIADPQGRLLEINQATRTIWNGDIPLADNVAEYAHYKAWWASTGKPLAPQEWTLARALSSGEELRNDEIEIETLDGRRKVILNSAAPIRDEQGTITGGVVSALDISEARRLEREVAERARELETVVETISDGIALLDTQGAVERSNLAFRTMLGFEQRPDIAARSMRGRRERATALAMRDEQGQPLDEHTWPSAQLLRGETLTGVDILVTTPEGGDLVVEVAGAPIRDESGQISGCVEVLRDVSERRRLEQRTREALNALVAMGEAMAQAPDGEGEAGEPPHVTAHATAHRLAELTHRVIDCQRVTISLLDPEADTLQPLVASDFSPKQEAQWSTSLGGAPLVERLGDPALVSRLHAGETLRLDLTRLPPTTARTYQGTATMLIAPMTIGTRLIGVLSVHHTQPGHQYTDEDVELVSAVARLAALVIERERLLGEREEARAAALAEREANQQMDALLSVVSHELKQPLTVMSMSAQLAMRRIARLAAVPEALGPPELAAQLAPLQEELTCIAQQTEFQDGLINDLLDAARVRTGKLAVYPEPVNLLSLVRSAVEEQRRLLPERVIRLDLPATKSISVQADGRRIKQVVTNYLTNALKYSPAARPVEVGVAVEDTQARVWVRDQGRGLAPDQQQRIFERFYRAPGIEVQSGVGIGLGLGLYICRTIVEQHGGQVGVESAPGQGSAFWFTLPANCLTE